MVGRKGSLKLCNTYYVFQDVSSERKYFPSLRAALLPVIRYELNITAALPLFFLHILKHNIERP